MTNTADHRPFQHLLAADEPGPFDVVNETGNGPLMIACDHASNRVPQSLNGLGIDEDLLALHIAYDIGAQQVAEKLSVKFDAPLLIANYSRLVLDLNRHFGDPGMFAEVSDQHVIMGNQNLGDEEKQMRIAALFEPYHQRHGQMVDQLKQKFRKPIILSVHSFTDQYQGFLRPWQFGVLWDQDEMLAKQLLHNFNNVAQLHKPPLSIGDNEPYHARQPLGYSLVEHAAKKNVEMALIEIRQDLITDEKGQQWAADILYEVIAPLLEFETL